MKTCIPPKGETKRKFQGPNASNRLPLAFSLFRSEYRPTVKGEHPGLCTRDVAKALGEMRNDTAAGDTQPCEKEAAELKEHYAEDIAAYELKESRMWPKGSSQG